MTQVDAPVSDVPASGRRSRVTTLLTEHSLAILTVSAFAVLLIDILPHVLSTDGWLALVDGRLIAHNGLPHTNTMTLAAHGHQWVDQQWLSQLAMYGIYVLGGVKLLLALNLLLVVGAYAAATVYAARRGGSPTMVAVVAVLAFLPLVLSSATVRPQSFAYLPFVLLVAQLMRPDLESWRVAALLALLAVWANVHGSVVLAAGFVVLRGVVDAAEGRLSLKTLALLVFPFPCIFASPYAGELPSYYHATAFNPMFGRYLEQWAPSTLTPLSLPLYVLLLGTVWVLGRAKGVYSRFEVVALAVAVGLALLAVRHWAFAALIATMLLPRGLTALRPRTARAPSRVAVAVVWVALAGAALLAISMFTRPADTFAKDVSPRVAAVVAAAHARTPGPIYATVRYADWLLWKRPSLIGDIRYDARYELMTSSQLEKLVLFRHGAGIGDVLGSNRILVLDPRSDNEAIKALRSRVDVLYETKKAFVAVVPAR